MKQMSKLIDEVLEDLDPDSYDVLEDIQPDDFVFVLNKCGQLKGISFPETMKDDDEVDPNVEEIINFMVEKFKNIVPAGTTLH